MLPKKEKEMILVERKTPITFDSDYWEGFPNAEPLNKYQPALPERPSFAMDDVFAVRETGKAVLVSSDNLPESPMWVPKSVIDSTSEVRDPGDSGRLIVAKWFADKNSWG